MNRTKKRSEYALSEPEILLPGWNLKERLAFVEGVKIYGLNKLKKFQRHIGTKTHEDVRIAIELYKKEVRIRELTIGMEPQMEEDSATNEDYKTWLYFDIASQSHQGYQLPTAALDALLDQTALRLQPATQELTFPNWRMAEIKDFMATIELSEVITNVSKHIPTKTDLEITGAMRAYTIMCEVRDHAKKCGRPVPSYGELRSGYIYLQCIVAALNDNDKLKKLIAPPNRDKDMARAQFVLKEWLMRDVGVLLDCWTKDEKCLLIVAIESFGPYDLIRIQSHFTWKTRNDLKAAINTIRREVQFKEINYEKSRSDRYLSLASWGTTLAKCAESNHQIAASERLIFALQELPVPESKQSFTNVFMSDMYYEEMSSAIFNLFMQNVLSKSERLVPLLHSLISDAKKRQDSTQAQAQAQAQAQTSPQARVLNEAQIQASALVRALYKAQAQTLAQTQALDEAWAHKHAHAQTSAQTKALDETQVQTSAQSQALGVAWARKHAQAQTSHQSRARQLARALKHAHAHTSDQARVLEEIWALKHAQVPTLEQASAEPEALNEFQAPTLDQSRAQDLARTLKHSHAQTSNQARVLDEIWALKHAQVPDMDNAQASAEADALSLRFQKQSIQNHTQPQSKHKHKPMSKAKPM